MAAKSLTTLTTTSGCNIEIGEVITTYSMKDDPSIWKWIYAFVFRKDKPLVCVTKQHRVMSIDNGTTLTVGDAK